MVQYDIQALERAVKHCEVNIKTFEDAIDAERATQRQYRHIIAELKAKLDGDNHSKT